MRNWKDRSGVWVSTSAGIGIRILERVAVKKDGSRRIIGAADMPAKDEQLAREPWIHLTNADGTTLAQIPEAKAGKVAQAALADIPENRRPTEEAGARLGYE